MSIVGTAAILHGTHLITDLDISTQGTVFYRAYSNPTPLSAELSMVFLCGVQGILWSRTVTKH